MKIKPRLSFLSEEEIKTILSDAYDLLDTVGVKIESQEALELMEGAGSRVDFEKQIARISGDIIDKALKNAKPEIRFYDQERSKEPFVFGYDNVFMCAGGTAIYIHDYHEPGTRRSPVTQDLIIHTRLVEALECIDFACPFILSDVPREITDTYRFMITLFYTSKPPFAASFSKEGFEYMKEMMTVMADGKEEDIIAKPCHIFPNDPSSPLSWTPVVIQNYMDCAKLGIPHIVIPIPLSGATCPVTTMGTTVQVSAENLTGIVISQLVRPGTPVVWGGGPSAFDFRTGMPIMAAAESLIMGVALPQVGKYLNLPTQANVGRADTKRPDVQGGFETGMGWTIGALCGINMVRGAGVMEFCTTQCHEKLVIDNEIASLTKRLIRGEEFTEETRAVSLIKEIAHSKESFLSSDHTFDWFRKEFQMVSEVVDRGTRSSYEANGCKDTLQRAHDRVEDIHKEPPRQLAEEKKKELLRIVKSRAKRYGVERLPIEDIAG